MQAANKLLHFKRISSVVSIKECSNVAQQKWDILCAVSLERTPVITRDYTEVEEKTDKLLQTLEFEQSHKSNFERRMEDDEKRRKLLKSGKLDIDELDKAGQQTGHDFLDNCIAELKAFKLAPRLDPKEEKNLKSNRRALDKHLLLVVKEKLGQNSVWILPQDHRRGDETLRQTAERILKEKCGNKVQARFFGNAPNGFYKYKYPKAIQKDTVGAKIFFYKAQFLGGSLDIKKNLYEDYHWATRNELTTLQSDYCKSVKMFLVDEH